MGPSAPTKPGTIAPIDVVGLSKLMRRSSETTGYRSTFAGTPGSSSAAVPSVVLVTVATTANLTLSGSQVIDGNVPPEGSYVLAKDQSVSTGNGIYRVMSGAWQAVYSAGELVQIIVHVTSGTANRGHVFVTDDGTNWRRFATKPDLTAHAATVATASVLGHVKVDGTTITAAGDGTISTPNDASVQKVNVSAYDVHVATGSRLNFRATNGLDVSVTDQVTSDGWVMVEFGIVPAGVTQRNQLVYFNGTGQLGATGYRLNTTDGQLHIGWNGVDHQPVLYVGDDAVGLTSTAIKAESGSGTAIHGEVFYGGTAVLGENAVNSTTGYLGYIDSGVRGEASGTSYYGVHGTNSTGPGVVGQTVSGVAVKAISTGSGYGLQVVMSGSGFGASISSVTGIGLSVTHSGSSTALNAFASGDGWAAYLSRSYSSAPTRPVVVIEEVSSTSTQPALEIKVTGGTGCALKLGSRVNVPYRQVTTSTTIAVTDVIVGTGTTAAAVNHTMPSASSYGAGGVLIVVDEARTAATRNITVTRSGTDTINGGTSATINTNGGVLRLYSNGAGAWYTF